MGEAMLRRYLTFFTATGVSTFSARFARLPAALAFVSFQPGVPTAPLLPARLGEMLMAPTDAASATTARLLPSMFPSHSSSLRDVTPAPDPAEGQGRAPVHAQVEVGLRPSVPVPPVPVS